MKKTNLNKIVSIAVLAVLLCATLVGAYLGVAGRNTEYVTIREDGQDVQRALYRQVAFIPNTLNDTWREAIRPSAALAGGYSYTITSEGADDAALKKIAAVEADRARLITGSASASVKDGAVVLTVPEKEQNSLIYSVAAATGAITFNLTNSSGQVLSEDVLSPEFVKTAYYGNSNGTYQAQVQFTGKGAKAYEALRNGNTGAYLTLLVDGQSAAYTAMSALTNDVLAFNANDWNTAFLIVDCLRSGALPAGVSITGTAAAEATLGGLLNGVIIAVAVVLLLACAYMIVKGRAAGLIAAWTMAAYLVAFFLMTALTAVSANWIMDLFSLIVIVVCVGLFVYGWYVLFSRAAAGGRGVWVSLSDAVKKNLKFFAILYGALLAVGVLLMFIFQAGVYGVMGRVVSLSAIISFLMLTLFVRVVSACCAAAKK